MLYGKEGIAFSDVAWYITIGRVVITMYQILEKPMMMPYEDIISTYDGRWVYVVKANITKHGEMIEGMPVVVADSPYEGNENGVYEQYDAPEYSERIDYDLNHYEPFIPSVFSVELVQ